MSQMELVTCQSQVRMMHNRDNVTFAMHRIQKKQQIAGRAPPVSEGYSVFGGTFSQRHYIFVGTIL